MPVKEKEPMIMHPRPSSIVAALYTLRDLDTDVVILHGPPGCCFKHARLLEEDGMRVVTTSLDESGFVFGGHDSLVEVLEKVIRRFNPKRIGIVGTCASMIIGEELHEAVMDVQPDVPVIEVEVHAGYRDNTKGVIIALESALAAGIISEAEFERQKSLLKEATMVEKRHGAASKEYLEPNRGDLKFKVAGRLLELMKQGKRGLNILNAKKETAFMFADINLAVNQIAEKLGSPIINMANLNEDVGLPKNRRNAREIKEELKNRGMDIHHITGGLDEYPVAGNSANQIIGEKYSDYDFAVITGVPHALPMDNINNMELFSITNGPRQVIPLKEMGHRHVMVEIDLHPRTLGINHIVESEFGATLREMAKDV
ncbi:putative methanogenesis marker 13 metalloprotein [Candidatus Methanoperedens nitroreducens]|uniref:Putative methanogenesis marker 13 metalloprotein n=1 Tax=Candidatus Methanoperedens nitratireducens TaxID=1392998 RepID=A0A062UXC5_9EURY|nr:Ni-sirohydrochlorin a,c-diamide reductive cyclase catalytic subunit [Candidatus Methanoperedens nitroreducens]KCZ71646.1 putative methanogenesis marker 13 metalloprotein [Candidatus Methanoperedens nitroreducens]MDJ1421273.1 Ni-sirohydrochlorin a,c-diamide reductive cyclase catalytic subunit [Candidatus Methanoperedens sp.]